MDMMPLVRFIFPGLYIVYSQGVHDVIVEWRNRKGGNTIQT